MLKYYCHLHTERLCRQGRACAASSSQIKAGNNITLTADGALDLIAAQNSSKLDSTNQNSSVSIGVSMGTSSFAIRKPKFATSFRRAPNA